MQRAVFTSTHGGNAHRALIIQEIEQASAQSWQSGRKARLDIMCFAFTDDAIRAALIEFLDITPEAEIRILADWNQGAHASPSVIRALEDLNRPDLHIRIKIDAPYVCDPKSGKIHWAYGKSHGMLHHKTMGITLQGVAERLIIGSFNWSSRGSHAYENTMVLERCAETAATLDAFGAEFDALWGDEAATMPLSQSSEFASKARQIAGEGKNLRDTEVIAALTQAAAPAQNPLPKTEATGDIIAAFSGRHLNATRPHYGFSPGNSAKKLNLLRPSGTRKFAPVSINSIALEAIRSVPDGHPIDVAMYALSPRVPEYAALLEAAARGCKVRFVLDGKLGGSIANRLALHARDKGLPIEVCTTNRRMHQKYLIAPQDGIVVTGTANMTEDATSRHADHRVLFRNAPQISEAFSKDFDTIWKRVDTPA